MATRKGPAPYVPKIQPWMLPYYEISDVAAVQAVAFGRATEEQQRRAFEFIVQQLCGTDDLSYRPASPRDSDFAEGKRFVGLICRYFSKPLTLELMRKNPSEQGNTPQETL